MSAPPTFVILIVCFASLALAEDFKMTKGKIYKDATISSVEADGIVLKTKTGISRVFEIALVLVGFDDGAGLKRKREATFRVTSRPILRTT